MVSDPFDVRRKPMRMIRVIEPETGYVAYWHQIGIRLNELGYILGEKDNEDDA